MAKNIEMNILQNSGSYDVVYPKTLSENVIYGEKTLTEKIESLNPTDTFAVGDILISQRSLTDLGDSWANCDGSALDSTTVPDFYAIYKQSVEYGGAYKVVNTFTTSSATNCYYVGNINGTLCWIIWQSDWCHHLWTAESPLGPYTDRGKLMSGSNMKIDYKIVGDYLIYAYTTTNGKAYINWAKGGDWTINYVSPNKGSAAHDYWYQPNIIGMYGNIIDVSLAEGDSSSSGTHYHYVHHINISSKTDSINSTALVISNYYNTCNFGTTQIGNTAYVSGTGYSNSNYFYFLKSFTIGSNTINSITESRSKSGYPFGGEMYTDGTRLMWGASNMWYIDSGKTGSPTKNTLPSTGDLWVDIENNTFFQLGSDLIIRQYQCYPYALLNSWTATNNCGTIINVDYNKKEIVGFDTSANVYLNNECYAPSLPELSAGINYYIKVK